MRTRKIKLLIVMILVKLLLGCSPVYQRSFDAVCKGSPQESFTYIDGIIKSFGYSPKKNKNILKYKDLIIGAVYERYDKTIEKKIGAGIIYRGKGTNDVKVGFNVFVSSLDNESKAVVNSEFKKIYEKIKNDITSTQFSIIDK